jgi:hypothetical protein
MKNLCASCSLLAVNGRQPVGPTLHPPNSINPADTPTPLGTRFLDDFPGVSEMPLQLPPKQRAAFEAAVRPLLDLAEAGDPVVPGPRLVAAVRGAIAAMGEDPRRYGLLRGVADYVQCTFAQCVLDAAAAWVLDPDRRAHRAALAFAPGAGAAALDEALLVELRSRLVAAGMGGLTAPLTVSLRTWQPPPAGAGSLRSLLLFPRLAAGVVKVEGLLQGGGSRVAWPALRRGLGAAGGGHWLEAVLGGDDDDKAAGSVVLTGARLVAGPQHCRTPARSIGVGSLHACLSAEHRYPHKTHHPLRQPRRRPRGRHPGGPAPPGHHPASPRCRRCRPPPLPSRPGGGRQVV